MQLASCRWAWRSAGPNQSQTNHAITELWLCYSVKRIIEVYVYLARYFKVGISTGPILESKDMCAIFQKKSKKMWKKGKKGKIFENLGKMYKFENIFKKGRWLCATIAHRTQ